MAGCPPHTQPPAAPTVRPPQHLVVPHPPGRWRLMRGLRVPGDPGCPRLPHFRAPRERLVLAPLPQSPSPDCVLSLRRPSSVLWRLALEIVNPGPLAQVLGGRRFPQGALPGLREAAGTWLRLLPKNYSSKHLRSEGLCALQGWHSSAVGKQVPCLAFNDTTPHLPIPFPVILRYSTEGNKILGWFQIRLS